MANHIRVITAIVFSQLVVLYFGFRMDVSLTGLLTTVAVASLVEIIYHVKIGRRRVGKECRSRWSPYH